jgi:hypothetical protein
MDNSATKERKMKRLSLSLLLAIVSTAAFPYGKVFFSPDKRAALEKQRFMEVVPDPSLATQPTQLEIVTVDGIVSRSSGRSTVWINGLPQYGRNTKIRRDLSGVTISNTTVPVGDSVNIITHEPVKLLGNGGSIKPNDK